MDKRAAFLEKRATLLLDCGKKYLIELGFEKEAQDPKVVLRFLEKIRTNENMDVFRTNLEKNANFDWMGAWNKTKDWAKKIPKAFDMDPKKFYGGALSTLGGALGGGLAGYGAGGNWRSGALGALGGGTAGAIAGNKYGDQIGNWLNKGITSTIQGNPDWTHWKK